MIIKKKKFIIIFKAVIDIVQLLMFYGIIIIKDLFDSAI